MSNWFLRLNERLEKGRPLGSIPWMLVVLIVVFFFIIDVIAVWLSISSFFAAVFAYLSALLLLMELLHESGTKLWGAAYDSTKEDSEKKATGGKETKEDHSWFWVGTYVMFVLPVDAFLRKFLSLIACRAWCESKELAIDTYKLRFFAFIFLLFAINFDICTRLFGK